SGYPAARPGTRRQARARMLAQRAETGSSALTGPEGPQPREHEPARTAAGTVRRQAGGREAQRAAAGLLAAPADLGAAGGARGPPRARARGAGLGRIGRAVRRGAVP